MPRLDYHNNFLDLWDIIWISDSDPRDNTGSIVGFDDNDNKCLVLIHDNEEYGPMWFNCDSIELNRKVKNGN